MAAISSSMTAADATVESRSTVFWSIGAECLIRFEQAGNIRSGAVLAIKPRGWQWGTEELTDRFIRVIVTDAHPADLEQYLVDYRTGPEGAKELVNKRLYYVDSIAVSNVAAQPGRVLITNKASVDNFMRNIIDHG